ncbi:hypothetical protein SVAN01_07953 [Stagonosporopsis vannaccii]|nr:hypothetical protein SVAN01_07953 [Stagonosporopsis vannaccii]
MRTRGGKCSGSYACQLCAVDQESCRVPWTCLILQPAHPEFEYADWKRGFRGTGSEARVKRRGLGSADLEAWARGRGFRGVDLGARIRLLSVIGIAQGRGCMAKSCPVGSASYVGEWRTFDTDLALTRRLSRVVPYPGLWSAYNVSGSRGSALRVLGRFNCLCFAAPTYVLSSRFVPPCTICRNNNDDALQHYR